MRAGELKSRLMQGATLVEMMIALVVGSISVAAAYASYQMVGRVNTKSSDLTEVHGNAREALRIISRDLRMAGFVNRDNLIFSPVARSISQPITVSNDVPLSCAQGSYNNDMITISYDDSKAARITGTDNRKRVTYQIACRNDRVELQQEIESSSGGSFVVDQAMSVIVGDIANLQFVFIDVSGNGTPVPSSAVERIELSFDSIGVGVQRGLVSGERHSATYRTVIQSCNLECGS